MVDRSKKPLGVRNAVSRAKKWQHKTKKKQEGMVVDGFKFLAKALQGAKHSAIQFLSEWLELEPNFFHQRKKALTYKAAVINTDAAFILPPMEISMQKKKTIVLDMDETLIHSSRSPLKCYDLYIEVLVHGEAESFYVLKRPGVDELLNELACRYELVIFTAAIKEYADAILDQIDPRRAIKYRLFRDSCTEVSGKFVKDLSLLGRDLKRVIIVDDNPNSYMFHSQNAVPVSSFVDDLHDRELIGVLSFFKVVQDYEDLREAIRHFVVRDPLLMPWGEE